jgi:hypothetical protein
MPPPEPARETREAPRDNFPEDTHDYGGYFDPPEPAAPRAVAEEAAPRWTPPPQPEPAPERHFDEPRQEQAPSERVERREPEAPDAGGANADRSTG